MSITYRLTFKGEVAPGHSADVVRDRIAQLFKLPAETAARLFSGTEVVLKKSTDETSVKQIHEAMTRIGAITHLEGDFDIAVPDSMPIPVPPAAPVAIAAPGAKQAAASAPSASESADKATTGVWARTSKLGKAVFILWLCGIAVVGVSKLQAAISHGFGSEGSAVETILKQQLRSPSSYKEVSTKTLWTGKSYTGKPAYIVRAVYEASNGFAAQILGCSYVSYTKEGSNLEWKGDTGVMPCGGDQNLWMNGFMGLESTVAEVVQQLRQWNFEPKPTAEN